MVHLWDLSSIHGQLLLLLNEAGLADTYRPSGLPSEEPEDTADLAKKHSRIADDDTKSIRQREASMMLSVAESALRNGNGNGQEGQDLQEQDVAYKNAKDALDAFVEIEDLASMADAARIYLSAMRLKDEHEEALMKSDELLQIFRTSGDQRGEGAMLLSQAQIKMTTAGATESLSLMRDARAYFRSGKVPDKSMEAKAVLAMASAYLKKKDFEEAIELSEEARELAQDTGRKGGEAEACLKLAVTYTEMKDFPEGLQFAQAARDCFKGAQDPIGVGLATLQMGEVCLSMDDSDQALQHFNDALAIFKQEGNNPNRVLTAERERIRVYIQKDKAMALKLANELTVSYRGKGFLEYHALTELMNTNKSCANYQEALAAAKDAVELVEAAELGSRILATALHNLAVCHLDVSDYELAEECADKSLTLLKDLKGTQSVTALCSLLLAKVRERFDPKTAAKDAEKALVDFQKMEDLKNQVEALLVIARSLTQAGDAQKALLKAEEAQQIARDLNDKLAEAGTIKVIADAYLEKDQIELALRAANQMKACVKGLDQPVHEGNAALLVSKVKLSMGDFEAAADAAQEAQGLYNAAKYEQGEIQSYIEVAKALYSQMSDEEMPARNFKALAGKVLRAAKMAQSLAAKRGDDDSKAKANFWMAMALCQSDRPAEGLKAAEEALDFFKKIGAPKDQAYTLICVAQLMMLAGDLMKAQTVAKDAMSTFQNAGGDPLGQEMAKQVLEAAGGSLQQQAQIPPEWLAMQAAQQQAAPESAAAIVPEAPKGLDPEMVKARMIAMVKNIAGDSDDVDGDTPLMESGIDSLASVELRNAMANEFQIPLPATIMFDNPSISRLTETIVEKSLKR